MEKLKELLKKYDINYSELGKWLNIEKAVAYKKVEGRLPFYVSEAFDIKDLIKEKSGEEIDIREVFQEDAHQDEWLTPEDVASLFNLKIATVRQWLWQGKIKGHKIGGKIWRIHRKDLDDFIMGGDADE